MIQVYQGENAEVLDRLIKEGVQVDAICTDPPYGLSFMNSKWDYDVPSVEFWKLAFGILKPGGYVLSFGGTRTYHRMVVNLEDAGFEIRDQLLWLYGTGLLKSTDISKSIDKEAGVTREVIGQYKPPQMKTPWNLKNASDKRNVKVFDSPRKLDITAPATEEAKQWDGWGTALKPSVEPIVLARKPLAEQTVVQNVLKYGTGGLNLKATQIVENGETRSPTNVIVDEATAPLLGHAARFFYCAKPNKKERSGLDHPTMKPLELIRYLCRLITPKGATILDPYAGSGPVGEAAILEGFNSILIEKEKNYVQFIKTRLRYPGCEIVFHEG